MLQITPKISIIIPLYNTEKYIDSCLESILNQTFKDYEVIVIDDCSTDNSVEVVKKFVPQFNDKIRIIKRDDNSGGAAIPRNMGIKSSRGKYIVFVDSDDRLTKTALEELYKISEKYQADVVYSENYFFPTVVNKEQSNSFKLISRSEQQPPFVDKPVLETSNITERITAFTNRKFWYTCWNNIFRREFLIENTIEFPNMPSSEDFFFIFHCICLAKTYVRIPNKIYIRIPRPDSLSYDKNFSIDHFLTKWANVISKGIIELDKLTKKINFFNQNSNFKYMVIDFFIQEQLRFMGGNTNYYKISPHQFFETMKKVLSVHLNDNEYLASYLFSLVNFYRIQLIQAQQKNLSIQQELENNNNSFNDNPSLFNEKIFSPKISIIIPMYNSEKYIGQCLESVLRQTLQDYEIIVIDDCSTDNSVNVVEQFIPKFNNRLQIVKRNKNSAAPGILRNIGIGLSSGKYLAFLDSDDLLTKTALEELYKAAEETQADVIHEEKFLITKDGSEEINSHTPLIAITWERKDENGFVTQNTPVTEDIVERLKKYSQGQFYWNIWNKFFKREFIIKNHITFPDLYTAEDMVFCFKCLCLAKRYVRVPNVVYCYRIRKSSVAHYKPEIEKHIHRQVKIIIDGSKYLNDFMNEFDIFEKIPQFRQNVLDIFIREHFQHLRNIYETTPIYKINEILCKEFLNASNVDASLISYFFSEANLFRFLYTKSQQQIEELKKQIHKLQQSE